MALANGIKINRSLRSLNLKWPQPQSVWGAWKSGHDSG